MKRWIQFVLVLFFSAGIHAQQLLWINELDSDTPGLDDHEFVELKSGTPYFALDNYVVVFFNGSDNAGNASYLTVSLNGFTTDINGLFVIGNSAVQPFPNYVIPDNTIQNGADGLAIYHRSESDFPVGTPAFVDTTLVDVIIYGTNDPDAVGLLNVFRQFYPDIKQLNEGKTNNTNSLQRDNDGNFYTDAPTPRRNNDGSGIDLNGLRIVFSNNTYNEGDTIFFSFETEKPVENDLILDYSLDNGNFSGSDYIAKNRLSIQKGQISVSSSIIIVDDTIDEGDEEMIFKVSPISGEYVLINNNIRIRIQDNDFSVADYGTPLSPTYGKVKSSQVPGYYDSLNGLKGAELKQALQNIISDETVVRAQTYNDVIDILKEADQNPVNSNQVWLVYLEKGRSKIDFQLTSEGKGTWNREHVWPRSRGGFNSIEGDNAFDGIDIFWTTNADSLRHGNSDAHHIRAVDSPENTRRGNQFYGQYTGPSNTAGSFRGDVSRSIFYMAVRYNGLQVVEGFPENEPGKFGDLTTLLSWHRADPPDDYEMNRNNVVEKWQHNRNPFVDMPELIEYIWGDKKDAIWMNHVSVNNFKESGVRIFPNPSNSFIEIDGIELPFTVKLMDSSGRTVRMVNMHNNKILDVQSMPAGSYFLSVLKDNNCILNSKVLIHTK